MASTAIWTEDLSNCQLDQDIDMRIRVAVDRQLEGDENTLFSDGLIVQACCGPLCFTLITFRGTAPYASPVLFRGFHGNETFDLIRPNKFYSFCWSLNLNYSSVCNDSKIQFKMGITGSYSEFAAIDDFQYRCFPRP